MSRTLDASLAQRLDQLEIRGRRHLDDVGRRIASRVALDWASATLAVVGAVAVCVRLVLPVGPLAIIIASTIFVAAAAIVATVVGRRPAASRLDALALFDHRLGLKDRIVASDEFLDAQDGFRRAALAEAAPWIDRAMETPLGDGAVTSEPRGAIRRRWAAATAGLILLAIALLIARPVFGFGNGDDAVGTGNRRGVTASGDTMIASASPAGNPSGGGARSAEANASGTLAAPASNHGRQQTSAGTSGGEPAKAGAARSGAASAPPSATRPGEPASSGDTRLEGSGAPSAAVASTRLSSRDLAGAAGSDATPSPNESGQAATADAAQAKAGTPSRPGRLPRNRDAVLAPDSVRQDSRPAAGSDRQGAGNQMGSGAGRGSNRDGLKRSRGVGSLLLAVPMEDRFIGTTNTGPVRSMTRPAQRSEASSAPAVQAANRGERAGDSGRIVHAPTSLHDQRLIRDYFDRR